jgi:hypothetical protein
MEIFIFDFLDFFLKIIKVIEHGYDIIKEKNQLTEVIG